MEKGRIVDIYQKPLTSEGLEGKAKLRYPANINGRDVEWWYVTFEGDGPNDCYLRQIRI